MTVTNLTAFDRAIQYIERNHDGILDLDTLAKVAGVSKFHFHRMFTSRFDQSVMDYVWSRRLTLASQALLEKPKLSLMNIAFDFGFNSNEAFTRAFKKQFGCTPSVFRQNGRKIPWREVPLKKKEHVMIKPVKIEYRNSFQVVGQSEMYDSETRKNIPNQWDKFISMSARAGVSLREDSFGICDASSVINKKAKPGTFEYMAAVEASEDAIEKLGADTAKTKNIPGGYYAVFEHVGPISKFSGTVDPIWSQMSRSKEFRLRDAPDFELYGPRFKGDAEDSVVEIWIPIEKPE